MSLKMEGMSDLLKQLEKMGNQVDAGSIKKEALMAGAEVIRSKIETNTPRSELRNEHAADFIVISESKQDENAVEIGPDKDHWYLQFPEWGTSKQPAQAFTERSFHEAKGEAQDRMVSVIKRGIGI
jgi:HK97 gp10 family phage protein